MPAVTESEKKRFLRYIEDWGLKFREKLKVGSYRWRLYLYSNLFEKDPDSVLVPENRDTLLKWSEKFKTEHLPNWVRSSIYDLKEESIDEYKSYLNDLLIRSTTFTKLKIAVYGLRLLKDGDKLIDNYMIEKLPELKKYAQIED